MTTVVKGAQSCCSVGSSLLRSSVSDHALLINEAPRLPSPLWSWLKYALEGSSDMELQKNFFCFFVAAKTISDQFFPFLVFTKSKEWEQDDLFGNLKGRCYL